MNVICGGLLAARDRGPKLVAVQPTADEAGHYFDVIDVA
jgi:hypothetical protein